MGVNITKHVTMHGVYIARGKKHGYDQGSSLLEKD